jgi:hypothetical protein
LVNRRVNPVSKSGALVHLDIYVSHPGSNPP